MKIAIGSRNPAKIEAVTSVFPEAEDFAYLEVPSNVSAQPRSDEETRSGAVNRAIQCARSEDDVFGIGLEGGVMKVEGILYLCNWGALAAPGGKIYTASGGRIPLPKEIEDALNEGKELGDIMDAYAKRQDVRKKEGAIGIFTNEMVSRKEMFAHVVKLLRGQWEFEKKIGL